MAEAKFAWAVNQDKLRRSIAFAKEVGKPDDEATVRARYEQIGGLILGDENKERVTSNVPREKMTIDQLKEVADTNNIDLTGCKTKADILAALEAVPEDDEDD